MPAAAGRGLGEFRRRRGYRSVVPSITAGIIRSPVRLSVWRTGPVAITIALAMTRTILIVDDHPSFRASARMLLEAEGFEVIGEAEDGASALRASRSFVPTWCCSTCNCRTSMGWRLQRA